MLEIIKNEKENVSCFGADFHTGGNLTIDSATFEVFDADDTSVQGSASASIGDNGTATPDVFGLVDTTASTFVLGDSYYVLYTIVIGSETKQYARWFVII